MQKHSEYKEPSVFSSNMPDISLTTPQKIKFINDGHGGLGLEDKIDKEWHFSKYPFPNDFDWHHLYVDGKVLTYYIKGELFGQFCGEYVTKIMDSNN